MTKHEATFDWERALDRGADMALEQSRRGEKINERSIMWALLCEAAKVSSLAYSAPPRTGYPIKALMPEAPDDVGPWQMMAAYLRGEVAEMPTTEVKPPQPSAEQITRAENVLDVWHASALIHKGNWSDMRKAVYMRACNIPPRKIRAVTGFSRQRIHHAKDAAMDDMLRYIRGC